MSARGGWARRGQWELRSPEPGPVGASPRAPGGPGSAPAGSGLGSPGASEMSDLGGGRGKRSESRGLCAPLGHSQVPEGADSVAANFCPLLRALSSEARGYGGGGGGGEEI